MDSAVECHGQALSTPELAAQITELAGHLNAANRRWLALITEFDRRKGWSDGLTQSCAHWLNWQCGIDIGAAMGRGELSYSKVRALTRVACPATEQVLLMIALHGTAHHVEAVVRQFRRVQETAEMSRETQQYAGRRLTYAYDDDGSLVIKARLPAETGAIVLAALEAAIGDLPLPEDPQRRFDVSAETSDFNTSACLDDPPSPSARRADALQLRETGRCELEDSPAIPLETARRLSCDASVVRIVENGAGDPLDVGRKTRSIPPALRRALRSRDQGCVFPGCTHKRYVDGHHIQHWAEGGIVIERLDDGAWRFVKRSGEALHSCAPGCTQPFGDWTRLPAAHRSAGSPGRAGEGASAAAVASADTGARGDAVRSEVPAET